MSDPVRLRTGDNSILPKIIEGISPEVELTQQTGGVLMTVTTKSGTKSALIPAGPTGPEGPQGPQGLQGVPGPAGANYELTEEDIEEIKDAYDDVKSAVQGYARNALRDASIANVAASDANNYKIAAANSAAAAAQSETDAETAAENAQVYKNNAAQSATEAAASASAASDNADAVQGIKTAVEALVDGFDDDAAAALLAVTNAEDDARGHISDDKDAALSDIADAKTEALSDIADAKSDIGDSVAAAAASATDAADSATAAAGSATDAAGSATAAAESAAAAAESAQALEDIIDDTAGEGDVTKVWSADKTDTELNSVKSALNELTPRVDSLEINKADVIISTASGSIASFPDGADGMPVKELVVDIEPVQDLHGYGAPWPAGGGKNLFNPDISKHDHPVDVASTAANDPSDLVFTDGEISGTVAVNTRDFCARCSEIYPAGTYTVTYRYVNGVKNYNWKPVIISYSNSDGWYSFATDIGVAASYTVASSDSGDNAFTFTTTTDFYVNITLNSFGAATETAKNKIVDLQIVSGSTASSWSPYSNVCPITGWTGANVWDDPKYGGLIEWNQRVDYGENDGWTSAGAEDYSENKNTRTVSANMTFSGSRLKKQYMSTVMNHKYLLSARITVGVANSIRMEISRGWKQTVFALSANTETLCQTILDVALYADNYEWLQFYVDNTGTYPCAMQVRDAMFLDLTEMFGAGNEPSTVEEFKALFPADYYPYNIGETTTVSAVNGDPYKHVEVEFPSEAGTVYGGSLTVNEDGTGSLVVNRAEVAMDVQNWAKSGARFYFTAQNMLLANYRTLDIKCSMFKTNIGGGAYDEHTIYNADNTIVVCDSGYADIPTFVTAVTGQTIVYPLSTAIEYQLSNIEVLELLKGQNNVWNNTGDTSVIYRADTKLYIDNRITQAIANALNA